MAQPRPVVVPLSPAQSRLWLLHQLEDDLAAYNFPLVVRIGADLDIEALGAALRDVVARHEALRTVFVEPTGMGEEPVQVVVPVEDVTLDVEVVVGAGDHIAAVVTDRVRRPFDLARDLPVRLTVVEAGDERVIVVVLHHITTDEWSDRPFLTDLTTAYLARTAGAAPAWEPLPVQYADYTLWQRDLLGDPADPASLHARQLDHWRTALAGAPEELALPTDRPRPAVPSYAGGTVDVRVPAEVHARLRDLCAATGASAFMCLHAAVAVLVHRLGAGDDIVLGAPIAGRTDEALEDLVGFFVNTLALRTDLSGNPDFAAVLDRVRAVDLAAFDNQDVPFDAVVEALNPARARARNPLFQVMVGYLSRPSGMLDALAAPWMGRASQPAGGHSADGRDPGRAPTGSMPDVHASGGEGAVAYEQGTTKFDLNLTFAETAGTRLDLSIEYAADLFDRETVEALAGRLVAVLDQVTAAPAAPISTVDVLDAAERTQVVDGFDDTARLLADPTTLAERIAHQAAATPDATAVIFGDARLTYAELLRQADAVAAGLAARGAGPESVVAVELGRSIELMVALVGVLRSGAAYVPLDPDLPPERAAVIVADAGAAVVIDPATLADLAAAGSAAGPGVVP
ncbi:MAG: condensation domain-containing protein, partial [Acidimicrobiales bacterium]|nr:condensation domain-containing protein [Acidimicrobiales bacterium]